MVIICGVRLGGKVDSCHGAYAATRFFHLYGMPIIPVSGTFWITAGSGEHHGGHATRLAWKSIAAAYLRTWGLVIALGLSIPAIQALGHGDAAGLEPLFVSALPLGASLYSWRWYRVSATERARRALCAAVIGTRCAPEALPGAMASSLRHAIESSWARRFPAQTPGDVARFGTRDPWQASLAYVLLRLHAGNASRAQADALRGLAEQVAQNAPPDTIASDGVYRPLVQPSNGTDAVA